MSIKDRITKKTEYKKAIYALENLGVDISFTYNNKGCSLCPFDDFIALGYNGESKRVDDIDEVKTTKCFNGKSLNEIYADVEFEW